MKSAILLALALSIAIPGFAQTPVIHPEVGVTMDRSDYALGDILEITLHNPTDQTLSFVGDPPYLIRYQDTGAVVFRSLLTVMHDVPAHSDPVYYFDTSDFDDGLLSPGTYEVVFEWRDSGNPLILYAALAEFELDTVVDGDEPTWGRVKTIFNP